METLFLSGQEVGRLLQIDECMKAVEMAFASYANGTANAPKVLGIHAHNGGFHIKAGILELKRPYFVAKLNANFPGNQKKFGLPTIQGVVAVCDASNGRLLALMDSIEITIIRTGAATGVAAKYLARANASVVTICGCGNQGRISLKALMRVRAIQNVFAFDVDSTQLEKFCNDFENEVNITPTSKEELSTALKQSSIVVTCTPSRGPFIKPTDISPGTFIAAVGSDNEEKQELYPGLLVNNKVVADIVEQCASIGELHHAIKSELVTINDVYAELGEIIIGKKRGRESDKEIIIFDSTGTALQDVAAAAIVYEKAIAAGIGMKLNMVGREQYEKTG